MTALQYCTVIGTFNEMSPDATDDGLDPDSTPLQGQITLICDARDPDTGTASRLSLVSETPPRTIVIDPFVVALDDTGSFVVEVPGSGQTGVTVPDDFTYTVKFALKTAAGAPVRIASFSFPAPAGETVDLTLVAPVSVVNGVASFVGPPGADGVAGPPGPPELEGMNIVAVTTPGTYAVAHPLTTGKTYNEFDVGADMTISMPVVTQPGVISVDVAIVMDDVGGWNVTLPDSTVIQWGNDAPPAIDTTPGAITMFALWTKGGSTGWYGVGNPGAADVGALAVASNLSDVANLSTARNNLAVHKSLTPQQYGAVGDGTTDDSTAFQNAINAALTAGVEVVVPPGVYLVTNLAAVSNTSPIRIRGLQTPGFALPTATMPVTLKNKPGVTTPIITCTRGVKLQDICFDGNGTSSSTGAVYAAAALELRMDNVKIRNCGSTALLLSGCDNININNVFVESSGSSSKAAVRIESYWSGTAQTVSNTVAIESITIYGSVNCALDIATGSTPTQTDYADFVMINKLHCEGLDLFGQPGNAGPLVKIGNVRHIMVNTFMLYGGPGQLIDYTATVTTYDSNQLGGVHFDTGVLLGADASFGSLEPANLVTLGGGSGGTGLGDGFTLDNVSVDNCTGSAVSVASTFGPSVQLGAVHMTSHVTSLLTDARSKLSRKPIDPSPLGHVARARKVPTSSGLWFCVPGTVSTNTPGLNTLNAHRLQLDTQISASAFAAEVTSGGSTATLRIGVYADNGGVPGELLYDSGSLAAATTGVVTATPGSPITLYPGTYWLAVVLQTAVSNMRGVVTADLVAMATSTLALQNTLAGWGLAGVTGALPNPWTGGNGTAGPTPRVAVKSA